MKILPLLVSCAGFGAVSSVMYFNHAIQLNRDSAILAFQVNSPGRQLEAIRRWQMQLTGAAWQDFSAARDTGGRLRWSIDRGLQR